MKKLIDNMLRDRGIEFEFLRKQDLLGTSEMDKVVSNLLFSADDTIIAVLKRMSDTVDEDKLRKLTGATMVRLASKSELTGLGLEYGEVPPVGIDVKYYADKTVAELEYCYGGSGDKPTALKIGVTDLLRINKAIIGDIVV